MKLNITVILTTLLISLSNISFAEQVPNTSNQIKPENISKLFNSPGISSINSSISVVSLKDNKILYQTNQSKPLAPASNLKLVTSAAALTLLKPEHRFKTVIYGDSYVRSGKLNGNLYLKGFGDPDLTGERLWRMVRKLKNTGITEVTGDLIADESFFDSKEIGEGWKIARYGDSVYSARISALSVNRNTVEVWIRSGNKNGTKGIITLDPDNDFFQIDNKTYTANGYSRMIISRVALPDGRNKVLVKGSIPLGSHSEVNRINLDNPALYTGYVLAKIMEKEGIKIKGKIRKAVTPTTAVPLMNSNSRTLSAIVYDFNKNSVNIIGEILLKYIGATYRGLPGSAEKGSDVIKKDFFEKMVKVNTKDFKMVDGSGLSPLNRITSEQFSKVLGYMYKHIHLQSDYMASLPVSGADGTLRKRSRRTEGERKYRAKTGFINGVSCLSGYTYSKDGEPIAFSIMMNNFSNMGSALSIQDKICTYLATNNLNF